MTLKKKKISMNSKKNSTQNDKNPQYEKCPKGDKDCLRCKLLHCPEEQ
jgi:hypothetical protein